MRRSDLAKRLIAAGNNSERRLLLSQNQKMADVRLGDEIRKACYAAWASDPVTAQNAASSMVQLVRFAPSPEMEAIALWVKGIANITKGKFELAADKLAEAAAAFIRLGRKTDAAQTQVANLLALAMLGRYDEAVRTGRKALDLFIKAGDELAAGKIEMNLSNVAARREHHRESERYCLSARKRFVRANERGWQTMAENGLANTYAELNDLEKADRYYRLALDGARLEKMKVTEAEVEASLGNLARMQGKFAEALRSLESSRRIYEGLAMPHQSAIADLEIADIYSELNLGIEAADIYERVSKTFKRLKLTAEEARSRLNHGRTAAVLQRWASAQKELKTALRLFEKEGNHAGRASTLLALAGLELERGDQASARKTLTLAAAAVERAENPRHRTYLRLLQGKRLFRTGKYLRSERVYREALRSARAGRQAAAADFALNGLGKIAEARGDLKEAESCYKRAIRMVEGMRSSLDTEFSMAFFAARVEPYDNLTRLLIRQERHLDAFKAAEAGRSRSLLDSLTSSDNRRGGDSSLANALEELRAELNQIYKRLDFAEANESAKLRAAVGDLEGRISTITRQSKSLDHGLDTGQKRGLTLNLTEIRKRLGDRILIEFVELDGEFSAFVLAGGRIEYVRGLGTAARVTQMLADLRFQFGSLRYGPEMLKRFGSELKRRTDATLQELYKTLLAPLGERITADRLIIVPTGLLYYVPFHALYDGSRYLVEYSETRYAPSAATWRALDAHPARKPKNSLLVGYADEKIPLVEQEIRRIRRALPGATALAGSKATFSAVLSELGRYDLVHIACHGQFRADNPVFSSLHLADGWVTMRDVVSQRLKARLVTLSACETGLSELFAGDEILGLARGFLTAGAENLIVSLWSVNDDATGRLMLEFYRGLQRGLPIAASLRLAQIGFIERGEHPYFWAPFILIGR